MLYVLPLEPLPERYTIQWNRWFHAELEKQQIPYAFIEGETLTDQVESGSVLDAEGTNYRKFTQMAQVCQIFKSGRVQDGDVFFTFDVWHPGLEAIPYMAQLEKKAVRVYGFLHAGSYTREDFAAPMAQWARFFERGWTELCTKIFVGTHYHRRTFIDARLSGSSIGLLHKVVVTGNPFNTGELRSMVDWVEPSVRKNVVIFPHRWDPEKRPDVFMSIMDLVWDVRKDFEVVVTTSRPIFRSTDPNLVALIEKARFPITVKSGLTKKQYYQELANAKVFVSTTIEENFGYCLLEAMTLGCSPVVPDAYSHPELLQGDQKYLVRTRVECAHRVSEFLDAPCPCGQYANQYDHSIAKILKEMGL
jgi:glycosyltransferase involved in cell wall biosynthesis